MSAARQATLSEVLGVDDQADEDSGGEPEPEPEPKLEEGQRICPLCGAVVWKAQWHRHLASDECDDDPGLKEVRY